MAYTVAAAVRKPRFCAAMVAHGLLCSTVAVSWLCNDGSEEAASGPPGDGRVEAAHVLCAGGVEATAVLEGGHVVWRLAWCVAWQHGCSAMSSVSRIMRCWPWSFFLLLG